MIDVLAISTASVTAINRSIYAELMAMGIRVEMVIPAEYPVTPVRKLKPEPVRPGDPSIHILKLKGNNPRLFYFPDLDALIGARRPAVVLVENDPVSLMSVMAGRSCRKHNAQLFTLSCENLSFDILPVLRRRGLTSIPGSVLKKLLFHLAKPNMHTVLTINDDGLRIFREKKFSHVVKVPLGYDPRVFYPDPSRRKRIREQLGLKYPVIAYFGRIVPEKGIPILIEALSRIDRPFHFMLDRFEVYKNPYGEIIEGLLQRSGLGEKVVRIEANHTEIAAYMNAADVVVIPSVSTPQWKEQYGRVGPEAMACGKVVMAARSGALPELIGDGGILFDEGDVESLRKWLDKFLETPDEFNALGTRAASRALMHLSIPTQASMYAELVKEAHGNANTR